MMKRKKETVDRKPKKLVLRRENVTTLDDDALHQVRGGGAMSGSKAIEQY